MMMAMMMVMMMIRRAIIIINGGTHRIGKTIRTMIMMINATQHGSRQAMCNTIGVYFLKVAPMLQPTVIAFKVFSLHCISSRWRCNVAWAVMMVRLVMGREGQTTFGYCCYCCHHHHHHHYRRHTASIVLIAIIGLIYIPAQGKSMLGITNMTRRTESEFSGFSPEQPMINWS